MSDLQDLQKQLNSIEELLGLLVHVSDEKMPQLKNDIDNIVKNVKSGFDAELLRKQAFEALNTAVSKADYTVLHKNLKQTSENLTSLINNLSKTVEKTYNNVDHWKNLYKDAEEQGSWSFSLGVFMFGVFLGFSGAVFYAHKILHMLM